MNCEFEILLSVNTTAQMFDTYSTLHYKYDLMERNLLVLVIQEIENPVKRYGREGWDNRIVCDGESTS